LAKLECGTVESAKYIELFVFLHKIHVCSVSKHKGKGKGKGKFAPVLT